MTRDTKKRYDNALRNIELGLDIETNLKVLNQCMIDEAYTETLRTVTRCEWEKARDRLWGLNDLMRRSGQEPSALLELNGWPCGLHCRVVLNMIEQLIATNLREGK